MCEVFARNGHRMVMLEEVSGVSSPDVLIDGIPADLKCLAGANNLEKRARHARKQGALLTLIQFDSMNVDIMIKIKQLSNKGIHGKYFIVGNDRLYDF